MLSEVLQLHDGRFNHRIDTDIGPERVATGSYSVQQDRLQLAGATDVAGRPNGLVRLQPPFVIDERGGRPVLWRSPAIKKRAEENGSVGMYDLLIHVSPQIGAGLSCSPARK